MCIALSSFGKLKLGPDHSKPDYGYGYGYGYGSWYAMLFTAGMGIGLNYLFGVPQSTTMQIVLIIAITALATMSVAAGLDKGVKRLSNPVACGGADVVCTRCRAYRFPTANLCAKHRNLFI